MNATETKALLAFGRYHYLNSQQLHKLLFARGSSTYAQKTLKDLTDQGLLIKGGLPSVGPGNTQGVWHVSTKGRDLLRRWGIDTPRLRGEGLLFLTHNLWITHAMLVFAFLEEEGVTVAELTHDLDLKRQRVMVETPTGERMLYAPDAWVDLRVPQGQMGIALEIDMATEHERFWRRKVRAILGFADGGYTNWGSESLTVAVVVPQGSVRVQKLIQWTEAELRALNMEDWGSLFWFLGLDPMVVIPPRWEPATGGECSVRHYLGVKRWRLPFETEAKALIGGGSDTP